MCAHTPQPGERATTCTAHLVADALASKWGAMAVGVQSPGVFFKHTCPGRSACLFAPALHTYLQVRCARPPLHPLRMRFGLHKYRRYEATAGAFLAKWEGHDWASASWLLALARVAS